MSEIFGLVLAGGESRRMGTDKGKIIYPRVSAVPQRLRALQLLEDTGLKSFLSCRKEQSDGVDRQKLIFDHEDFQGHGPLAGLLGAHQAYPDKAWLVFACDFPLAQAQDIQFLIQSRKGRGISTVYQNEKSFLEPLFAIWEPETLAIFQEEFKKGEFSARRILEKTQAHRIQPLHDKALVNINSPAEAEFFLLK